MPGRQNVLKTSHDRKAINIEQKRGETPEASRGPKANPRCHDRSFGTLEEKLANMHAKTF